MGMTDKQFNGFIRFILDALLRVQSRVDDPELKQVIDNLQKILED